jgi:hypothetical protein
MIKVFQLNGYEWWAGEDFESCVARAMADEGLEREDLLDGEEHELTETEMGKLIFHDEGDEAPSCRTFARELARTIDRGATFPCFFATTEY